MKFLVALISVVLLCLFSLFQSCSSVDDSNRTGLTNSLSAALGVNCPTNINYQDDNGNVYAYRADNIFGSVSIQTGGHSTPDESTDLGLNLFAEDPLFGLPELSSYAIDGGSGDPGTAYVFYIDGVEEFISTDNNTGKRAQIERLTLDTSGVVTELVLSVSGIEMYNTSDPEELICLGIFQLSFIAE